MEELKFHIQNQIIKAIKHLQPFPYLVIDNVLPDNIFNDLKVYVDKLNNWERFTIHEGRFSIKNDKWDSVLKLVNETLYSESTKNILIEKFKDELVKKKEYHTNSNWNLNLSIDLKNYEIPPHMDGASKQISTIYYIKGGNVGTSLYTNQNLNYLNAKKVGEVLFKENRMFIFCASVLDRTWHGVEKSKQFQKRIAIQGFLELNQQPNLSWHSFGIGSIRYKYKKRNDKLNI